ncbi:O-succinylhomoserine sulfhydrylase [Xanthovirga aplysinae]|uniref:O-succinylhomoserine sulfhydrylase n=1 Tax=Xanthovirga aplysinae TaxID=2529853 RepID=UPI0012BC6711|nr:O-succinylhomoserine sulfhydrylase [Xanthovirga aplysinae]MTI31610.1 O-succinylhomoserine sulfhydrylase [Xanthovirga aplysinae]
MSEYKNFETIAIRTQSKRTDNREHSTPLYLTSSYIFNDAEQARALFAEEEQGNIYSRFDNPNADEFIKKMTLLEGTEAGFATASGMAAVFSSLAPFLKTGDHIVSSRSVFGNTHKVISEILPDWGVKSTFTNLTDHKDWENAIRPNTKVLFLETPSNPTLDIIEIEWLAELANKHNALLVVDNCFATPYLQQPAKLGAHIVIHSATKYIDGQGRVLGGIILGSNENIKKVKTFAKRTGPAISPFNAWVLSKSLETLAVRVDRQCENAERLAKHLNSHEEIASVKYPFLKSHPQHEIAKKQMKKGGGLLCFEVKGGVERGRKFLDALQMLSLTANLGDTRTIATHPASTTHAKVPEAERQLAGITGGMIRISAGLEHYDDILEDIEQALAKSK